MPRNNHLDVTIGVYQTQYTLTRHKDGGVTVREPCMGGADMNGELSFRKIKVPAGKRADTIKAIFDANDGLCGPDPECTPLQDLL